MGPLNVTNVVTTIWYASSIFRTRLIQLSPVGILCAFIIAGVKKAGSTPSLPSINCRKYMERSTQISTSTLYLQLEKQIFSHRQIQSLGLPEYSPRCLDTPPPIRIFIAKGPNITVEYLVLKGMYNPCLNTYPYYSRLL